jgi:hypothetical protein
MPATSYAALSQSLAIAARALANDLPDLVLPPATNAESNLSAGTLTALGVLYLQAELEQAGIIPAAEALVEARTSLDLPSERSAELLERFAARERNWYDRQSRANLFARVFGTGAGATPPAGDIVNHDFERRFAAVCSAVERAMADGVGRLPVAPEDDARIRLLATDLLANLGLRQYGNTLFAARRIQEQLEASIALLKEAEIEAMFHTKGFWPTVARILEPSVPDLARLVARGQSGQHLLDWLGAVLGEIGSPSGVLLPPNSPVFGWAARWLEASGLSASDRERRVA